MDFDITFDSRSTLGVPTDPLATPNARMAAFDLDTIYGQGPFVTPQFYDPEDPAKLRIESGGIFEDLPRNADMIALIPDPRSDQHIMIAGLHCAFILFHNKAVDHARAQGLFEDLPRNADMIALIPDPRSDQHIMIAGLHCAFILFHNKAVDHARAQGLLDPAAIFAEAKR